MGENEIEEIELERAELYTARFNIVGVSMILVIFVCLIGCWILYYSSRS